MPEKLVTDDQIIEVIRKHQGENLTVRRLMELLGYYSTSTVQQRIEKLETQGLIKRKMIRKTVIEICND